MIRLPNKLYRFDETILADFVAILHTLDEGATRVADLHEWLKPTMATEDFLDALTLLLTRGTLQLDTDSGVIIHAH